MKGATVVPRRRLPSSNTRRYTYSSIGGYGKGNGKCKVCFCWTAGRREEWNLVYCFGCFLFFGYLCRFLYFFCLLLEAVRVGTFASSPSSIEEGPWERNRPKNQKRMDDSSYSYTTYHSRERSRPKPCLLSSLLKIPKPHTHCSYPPTISVHNPPTHPQPYHFNIFHPLLPHNYTYNLLLLPGPHLTNLFVITCSTYRLDDSHDYEYSRTTNHALWNGCLNELMDGWMRMEVMCKWMDEWWSFRM